MTYDIRVALRKELIADWDATAARGYSPESGATDRVRIHLGEYNDDMPFPQIALVDVSSTARNASGYYATKADGSGAVQKFDGRLDVRVFAGDENAVDRPEELASELGKHVRTLIHANNAGLTDSSGNLLAENLAPLSEPVVRPETDYSPVRYMATVETGYESAYEPPA